MPIIVLRNEEKMSATEHELLVRVLAMWFGYLDCDPVLLIGVHRTTGGLSILPFQSRNLNGERVKEILNECLAYLENSLHGPISSM